MTAIQKYAGSKEGFLHYPGSGGDRFHVSCIFSVLGQFDRSATIIIAMMREFGGPVKIWIIAAVCEETFAGARSNTGADRNIAVFVVL